MTSEASLCLGTCWRCDWGVCAALFSQLWELGQGRDQAGAAAVSTDVPSKLLKQDTGAVPRTASHCAEATDPAHPILPRDAFARQEGSPALWAAHLGSGATAENKAQTRLGMEAAPTSPSDLPWV